MRILVTGAYGLIGSACLARLHRDGHALVGVGRAVETAKRSFPYAAGSKRMSPGSQPSGPGGRC